MKVLGVHHVSINVSDVQKSLEFYTSVLGLSVRGDRPNFSFDGAWLDIGGQQVHLIQGEVPPYCGQHFAVEVADMDVVIEELRGRGLEVTDPRPVARNRQAFLFDPDGNQVELQEVASS
jgi:glyoxylase I family protein